MNVEETLAERGETHGRFDAHAGCTQDVKRIIRKRLAESGKMLSATQQEALDMICHKIGRIVAGDPNHVDHWFDISGYATLIVKELEAAAEIPL